MEDLPINLGEKLGFLKQPKGFATKAIHAGQEPDQWKSGAVVPPIVTSSTFSQKTPGDHTGFRYGRYGNPTRSSLDACLAALDDAKYAVSFSAGVSVLTAIMTTFESGENLISSKNFFAGDFIIWDAFKKLGVEAKYIDFEDLNNLAEALDEKTRMVWIESPMNPSLSVLDIKAIADVIHSKSKAFLVVDNTFLTPYFQRPLELGADIVFYSITKFIGGHSDIVGGSMSTNNQELYEKIKASQISLGVIPSPFTSPFQKFHSSKELPINRSLRTLSVRMEKHFENGYVVATFLESHPKIEKVNHPALKSHKGFEIAKRQAYGHSGILSFYIKNGTLKMSKKFFKSLKLVIVGESLGGTETLASFPWIMSHSSMPEDERIKAGVTESLIRISIGLEDVRDVIEDLGNALDCI